MVMCAGISCTGVRTISKGSTFGRARYTSGCGSYQWVACKQVRAIFLSFRMRLHSLRELPRAGVQATSPGRRILCLLLICSSLKAARLRRPLAFACRRELLRGATFSRLSTLPCCICSCTRCEHVLKCPHLSRKVVLLPAPHI